MAQTLKDEIKENILQAALVEFFDKGYKSAAMRSIADKAKVPASLIYTYYKNKEDLFDAVLRPVLYDWQLVLTTADDSHTDGVIYGLSQAETDCMINLFQHRCQFIILADKSEGTKYEHERDRFIQEIEKHLQKHRRDEDTDEIFVHIVANNFVDGMMQLMYHYKGKEWALMMLHKLTKMYLSGIGF